jgi:hypothetical protein
MRGCRLKAMAEVNGNSYTYDNVIYKGWKSKESQHRVRIYRYVHQSFEMHVQVSLNFFNECVKLVPLLTFRRLLCSC